MHRKQCALSVVFSRVVKRVWTTVLMRLLITIVGTQYMRFQPRVIHAAAGVRACVELKKVINLFRVHEAPIATR